MTKWYPELYQYSDGHYADFTHTNLHRGIDTRKSQFRRYMEAFFFDDEKIDELVWAACEIAVEEGILRAGVETCSVLLLCERENHSVNIGITTRGTETPIVEVCFARVNGDIYRCSSLYPEEPSGRVRNIDLTALERGD